MQGKEGEVHCRRIKFCLGWSTRKKKQGGGVTVNTIADALSSTVWLRPSRTHKVWFQAFFTLTTFFIFPSSFAFAQPIAKALFNVASPSGSPFPSDLFTVEDSTQNTGRRVNLPLPDCTKQLSDCADLAVINTLDGFNVQPRLAIPFDRSIDLTSLMGGQPIFLVSLGSTQSDGSSSYGRVVGLNQIVWDPNTNTLYAESDGLLEQ